MLYQNINKDNNDIKDNNKDNIKDNDKDDIEEDVINNDNQK